MKKVMKRKVLFVIAAVLVLSLSVGFASAYFSDHDAAQGTATIHMGGQSSIVEKVDKDSKSVQIKNTGDTEIVVRVAIYGPTDMKISADENYWKEMKGFYYYKYALQPGESGITVAGTLVAETTYPAGTDLGSQYEIVVVQECEQAHYDENNKLVDMDEWFTDRTDNGGEGE